MSSHRARTRAKDLLPTAIVRTITIVGLMASPALAGNGAETPHEINERRVLGSIEDRVQSNLETAGGELDDVRIDVQVTPQRIVVLAGRVPSQDAKERAGRLALYAVGVASVDNQLEVRLPPAPPAPPVSAPPPATALDARADQAGAPSDRELARRVARQIAASLGGDARAEHRWFRGWRVAGDDWSFEVDADDGVVRLDGRIREPIGIDAIVAHARAVPAVRSVEPSLEVEGAKH